MADLILTVTITFLLILFTAVLISYCKRRQNRTRHGLTGMCHQSGGTMCSNCSSQLQNGPDKNGTSNTGNIHKAVMPDD